MKRLEKIEEVLVVVDMVNGFVKGGALADPYIAHIIPEHVRLVKNFLHSPKKMVIFIKDAHTKDCSEFQKFPVHCLDGSWESELVDELKPFEKDALVFQKNSRSAMFAPGFISTLDQLKELKRVISIGCCTDLCDTDLNIPMINYFDQMNRNVEVIVPINAVETYDAPHHQREEYTEAAFKLMEQEGIQIVKRYGGMK